MDITLNEKNLRIPKNVTIEYMMKLDPQSLKSLCQTNKEYRTFCLRSNVWRIMFKRDFPEDFDSFPIYLNEPNWMRVYFWFNKKNTLKDKLNLFNTNERFGFGTTLFSGTDQEYGSSSWNNIIGSLLTIGAKFHQNGVISLRGIYLGKHSFSISNRYELDIMDRDYLMLTTTLSRLSKLYTQLIDDVKTFIFMNVPKNFKEGHLECDMITELFFQDVPNYSYNNCYSYLFIPELTIDEDYVTEQTYSDYIKKKLLPLEPILVPTHNEDDADEFFSQVITNEYDIDDDDMNIGRFVFGVYHGTPFLIFDHYNNDDNTRGKLYLLCPSKNPQILLDNIEVFIQSLTTEQKGRKEQSL